jgi:hypothetical protein
MAPVSGNYLAPFEEIAQVGMGQDVSEKLRPGAKGPSSSRDEKHEARAILKRYHSNPIGKSGGAPKPLGGMTGKVAAAPL